MKECTKCGSTLEPDEEKTPRIDKNGDVLCDRCFNELYQYLCPICEEDFYENYNQKISPKYFIITNEAKGVTVAKPGLYEIISLPFYADGMIETHLFSNAIKRLCDTPKDLDEDDLFYPLYFICESCTEKILKKNHP